MSQNTALYQALQNFHDFLKSTGRANATILAYTKDIDQLVEFLGEKGITAPADVQLEDINAFKDYLAGKNYTAKSISRKINSIKSFFRQLIAQKVITSNPAEQVSHPKYDLNPPRILSKLEYRALRDTCRDDVRISAIIEVLLQTGIRIGELASLTLEDLNLDENKITIKPYESQPGRVVPINQAAREALDRYLAERPRTEVTNLFVTKTGNKFLVRNIRSSIDRFFRLAGIEGARVNDLRHTFIAHQLMGGTPLVYVSKLVGHKRLSTTERYLELVKEKVSKERPRIEEL
jgi:site-specific recombinase XerD